MSTIASSTAGNNAGEPRASGGIGSARTTYVTPTATFTYVMTLGWNDGLTAAVASDRNDCRSIHISFVAGTDQNGGSSLPSYPPGTGGTLTLVQEAADPIAVATAPDGVESLDAELAVGQSWAIRFAYNQNAPSDAQSYLVAYINGYGICDKDRSLRFDLSQ